MMNTQQIDESATLVASTVAEYMRNNATLSDTQALVLVSIAVSTVATAIGALVRIADSLERYTRHHPGNSSDENERGG